MTQQRRPRGYFISVQSELMSPRGAVLKIETHKIFENKSMIICMVGTVAIMIMCVVGTVESQEVMGFSEREMLVCL